MKSYNFDSLKFATEGLTGFGCTVIQDDANLPSFMIPFSKRTNAQLFDGGSEKTHSAFIVDDVEYKRFFASKFLNCIVDGRAYSWPGMDPAANINYDQAIQACNAKGNGFHLLSMPERAVIDHLIYKSGFIPRGNTNYGKSHVSGYSYEAGEATLISEGKICRTATGSGPATWFHDGTRDGIADWVGNVWKWISGARIVDGEIQIFFGNAAAKQANAGATSTHWKAIMPSGALVEPGTVGTLKYTKDLKIATATGEKGSGSTSNFGNLTANSGVTIPEILYELHLMPKTGVTHEGGFWINNEGERLPIVGAYWYDASNSGPSALGFDHPRTHAYARIGLFSAFMELQSVS